MDVLARFVATRYLVVSVQACRGEGPDVNVLHYARRERGSCCYDPLRDVLGSSDDSEHGPYLLGCDHVARLVRLT
jgi:hypothetical protein